MELLQEQRQKTREYIFAGVLWLITTILGALSFFSGRAMILRTYSRFFPENAIAASFGRGSYSLLNILVSITLAMLVIAIVIGGFEFHLRDKHLGSEKSRWLFARTLAVEVGFLLLALFI